VPSTAVIALLVLLAAVSVVAPARGQQSATPPPATRAVSEETVHEVASQLRCVVCQNLSVADSPSEMAGQMRVIVRERLAAGDSPEQVRRYFVERYGEWILLSPRTSGFTLLVWILPIVGVVVGLAIAALLLRRWTRRRAMAPAPMAVDAAMSERIRREMESEP
jgi:cytochrome c-type biogenesis protein CcmH